MNLHVISATHRDIHQMIQNGEFREDLYYRLNGITLQLPLLRDREDKAELIRTLLREESGGQEGVQIADDAFRKLLDYSWPGNIRQLRNALRTASALCRDGLIRLSNLPQEIVDADPRAAPVAHPAAPGYRSDRERGQLAVGGSARGGVRGAAARARTNALEHQPHGSSARYQPQHVVSQDSQTPHRSGTLKQGPRRPETLSHAAPQALSTPDCFAAWVARASISGGLKQS